MQLRLSCRQFNIKWQSGCFYPLIFTFSFHISSRILSKLSIIESRNIKVLRRRIITLIVFVILFGVWLCKLFSCSALGNCYVEHFFNLRVAFYFLPPSFLSPFVTCLSSGFKHIKHPNWLLATLKSQAIKSLIFRVRHLSQFPHISPASSVPATTELFYMD